jgi:hypothetical protein
MILVADLIACRLNIFMSALACRPVTPRLWSAGWWRGIQDRGKATKTQQQIQSAWMHNWTRLQCSFISVNIHQHHWNENRPGNATHWPSAAQIWSALIPVRNQTCLEYIYIYQKGWPEPYICTVYNRIFGDFPAKNTAHTPYIYGSGQPYSSALIYIALLFITIYLCVCVYVCVRA